ncbi:MAG: 50S ribosomal protein L21 [Chloroflexota bacterium]
MNAIFDKYAIFQTGGKQYRVEKDEVIDVELLDSEAGKTVVFKNVLFLNDGKDLRLLEAGMRRRDIGPFMSL